MSFNPAGIPSAQYIGAPYSVPSLLGTRLKQLPRVVPLTFNWASYGVSNSNNQIQVPINLAINAQTQQLDAIRGVYIDNTGSDAAVYVYFPDTGHLVTCAQFSTNWQPAYTNMLQCVVIGKGFVTGDTSQTKVFLTNQDIPPGESVELELVYPQYQCSPRISRGTNQYTSGFTVPAIGDQWQFVGPTLQTTSTTALFGSPYAAGGYITLTDMEIALTNNADAGITVSGSFTIKSTGISGTLYSAGFAQSFGTLPHAHGMNIKLNANETWQLVSTVTAGGQASSILSVFFGYSYQGSGIGETLFNFGNFNNVSNTTRPVNPAQFAGAQFTAPETGSVLSVNFGGLQSNLPQSISCAIYSDNAGSPGSLLSISNSVFVTGNQSPIAPYQFNFPTPLPSIITGTNYWVVFPGTAAGGLAQVNTVTTAAAQINGSGRDAATIAGLAVGLNMGAGENFQLQVNCQQP